MQEQILAQLKKYGIPVMVVLLIVLIAVIVKNYYDTRLKMLLIEKTKKELEKM